MIGIICGLIVGVFLGLILSERRCRNAQRQADYFCRVASEFFAEIKRRDSECESAEW